jgi:flagellar assembly protein FliH
MSTAQKFFFNTDFEEEAKQVLLEIQHEAEVIAHVEEEEAAPTFSEEELQAAKAESFSQGKEEGIREAATATEQRVLETLNSLNQQTLKIFQEMEDVNVTATQNAMSIGASIVKKLFPYLNQRQATKEVEELIQTTLQQVINEPEIRIRVNSDLYEAINDRLLPMLSKMGHDSKIKLNPDNEMPEGNCQIEWESGGASRDATSMWKEIDDILQRNLGENWTALKQVSDAIEKEAYSELAQTDTTPDFAPTKMTPESIMSGSETSEIDPPIMDQNPKGQGDENG